MCREPRSKRQWFHHPPGTLPEGCWEGAAYYRSRQHPGRSLTDYVVVLSEQDHGYSEVPHRGHHSGNGVDQGILIAIRDL